MMRSPSRTAERPARRAARESRARTTASSKAPGSRIETEIDHADKEVAGLGHRHRWLCIADQLLWQTRPHARKPR